MAYINTVTAADYVNADKRRHPAIFREAPSSLQPGPIRLEEIYLRQLQEFSNRSVVNKVEQVYAALRDQLASLQQLGRGWDSYDAPVPNAAAVAAAQETLKTLWAVNAAPAAVLPSADGGVGICFMIEDRYAHIELLNNGDAHALMYAAHAQPDTWQLSPTDAEITEAWKRISAHLQP